MCKKSWKNVQKRDLRKLKMYGKCMLKIMKNIQLGVYRWSMFIKKMC